MINNFTKHIHQIWYQPGDLKEQWNNKGSEDYFVLQKTYTDFCRNKNWEYTLWREDTILPFVKQHFPEYYKDFINLDSIIKKVDCARLMILYVMGGVYVDVDSFLKRDLDDFLNLKSIKRDTYSYTRWHINPELQITHSYDLIAGQEKTVCEYHYTKFGITIPKVNNAVIFCGPKVDLILEILKKGFERKEQSILNSFGVQTFSNVLYNYMREFIDSTIDTQDYTLKSRILILPFIYFYEMDVDTPWYIDAGGKQELVNDKRQFIVHKFDGNWDGEQYKDFIGKLTNNNISKIGD